MRVPSEEELVLLLESLDLKDRKDALQVVCNALEAGLTLRLENNLLLASLIARQRHSSDEVLRRWFYKYVGLARAHSYLPWLLGQLTVELDLQTLAWLSGAIVALLGPANGLAELRHRNLPDEIAKDGLVYGAYFRPELFGTQTVAHVTNADTFLTHRWATFLNARWRESRLSEYVRELGEHPDSEVAEFSLWSAMRQGTSVGESLLDPDKISAMPAAVRRWAYHLIAADSSARIAYSDLILRARTNEHDERAREGLAAGLVKASLDGRWRDFADDWRRTDPSERVKRVLRSGLDQRTSHSAPRAGVFQAVNRKMGQSARQRRDSMKGVPKVVESRREMMYLIAADTIAFSEASDGDQLSIARNILEEFSVQQELARLSTNSTIVQFTGDGVIIGVRGEENALTPVRTALDIVRKLENVYKFQLRLGIHFGAAYVLSMSDGSKQLLGHVVNTAVRIMSASPENGLLVSDSYYNEVFHHGREPLPGFRFEEREITDKHGHRLRCYSVLAGNHE